jgi:hypothetical protein
VAETAGSLATVLSRRIRDPQNTAHDLTTVVYPILSYCQQLVNAAGDVRREATLPALLSPVATPFTTLFINNWMRMTEVRVGKNTPAAIAATPLPRINWRTLAANDPHWLRATAPRPRYWDLIGQNVMLLWPLWTTPFTILRRTLVTPATLTTAASITELPDEHMPMILALAESVLLLRQRLLTSIPQAAERAQRVSQGLAIP